MLFKKTVDPSTLELLSLLQYKKYLNGFYLAGGTALSLYYGHRKSIDLDLFTISEFDTGQLLENIQSDFSYQLYYTGQNALKGQIDNINVDFIAHKYPYLEEPLNIEDISLLSEKDIIAMKLNAISISGQRVKDYIDIYYALQKFSLSDMVNFYKAKYNQENSIHVIKSLIYFDDIHIADWPVMIKDPSIKWPVIRNKIEKEVLQFIKEGS